ncbi:MAG: hypothetical protein NT120_01805 [Candidatus Aenigmarchaeota archaeon]|nr:hypothetical protein [Candidatus Aenigmarchaeota archaeon]
MKKLLLLILLVSVILVSGCVQQATPTSASRGLTIRSFDVNPSQVQANEPVLIDVAVDNVGGTTATNAQLDFYGVQDQWRDSTGNTVTSTLTRALGTMTPPEPSRNVPGQTKLVQLELRPPELPQGITTALPLEARVTYDYKTSGFINMPAVSEDEYRRMQINKEVADTATVVNSAGPLAMSMDTQYIPIRVDTTSTDDTVWPLKIILTNVGDGFPITQEDDVAIRGAGGKLQGTIQLLGPAEFAECLGATSGKSVDLDNSDITLRLRSSGSVPIACSIKLDPSTFDTNHPKDTVKLIFDISYRYYVSSKASVMVTGR